MDRKSATSLPPARGLESALADQLGTPLAATWWRPLETTSTQPIWEVRAHLVSGGALELVCKRLEEGQRGKDGRREAALYETLLAGGRFGAPHCHAVVWEPDRRVCWLFLEDLGGWRLEWCSAPVWQEGMRWAARLHADTLHHPPGPSLGRLDALAFSRLATEALTVAAGGAGAAAADRLATSLAPLDIWLDRLAETPAALVHGDLSGHNLLVRQDTVHPIDWEWAATGPPVWDVATLAAGWKAGAAKLVRAYADERARSGAPVGPGFSWEVTCGALLRRLWWLRWLEGRQRCPERVKPIVNSVERLAARLQGKPGR